MDRALEDGVAGGAHIQRVPPALRHGAHWAEVLRDLRVEGVGADEGRTHTERGWGETSWGEAGLFRALMGWEEVPSSSQEPLPLLTSTSCSLL